MRLHRLTVQAFGPFAGREEVDFDSLAGSGLFLLHGPTGAGKTSVLDAVCYALYGVVPGPRARGGRLRSDHAPEGVPPEVTCEFSVGPRRLEVTRCPAWDRPKRRGDGVTTEQAKVLVRELVNGEWIARATRLDEAGHLLDGLLGLGHEQFTKLVLLPQGDFAAFLRADAESRRAMLERLFDTDRFSDVQQWLRDTAGAARREVDEARTVTRELLARADQACSRLPGDPGPGTGAATAAADGAAADGAAAGAGAGADTATGSADGDLSPRERVARRLARALHAWEDATSRRAATQSALARARAARIAGTDLARRQSERSRLAEAARRLSAQAEEHEARRSRVRHAERARGVAPVAPQLTDAETALDAARAALDRAVREAASDPATLTEEGGLDEALALRGVLLLDAAVLAGLDDATLAASARALRERRGHLRGIAQEAAGLPPAVAKARRVSDRLDHERQALDDVIAGAAALGPALEAEQERLTHARALAESLPGAVDSLAVAEGTAAAVLERERLAGDVAALERRCATGREARDSAREEWLDLRERRLRQMAAELAEQLADGTPCPVCGSCRHPAPAPSGPHRVSDAQEDAAREEYEAAEAEFERRERAMRALAERLATVTGAAAGLDPTQAAQRLDAARTTVEACRAAQEGIAGREDTVARLLAASARAQEGISAAGAVVARTENELAAATAAVGDLQARVDDARGADVSLEARAARLETGARRLEAMLTARREHTDALRAAAAARRTALAAAREAGFGDLAGALAAVLPEDERTALEDRVRAYDSEFAAVTAQLADPSLAGVGELAPPDLVELASAEVLAEGDDEACARAIAVAEGAAAQLREIDAALAAHLAAAEPVERRYRTVSELSRCADGTGGDNARRMSLSAYVLAARLEQVAEAASRRLAQMSSGRYTLVHSDEVVKGQRRAGLGLHVVDAWTGRQRDTTSLSGGESFYTSLALALGLADVVSAEAGGTAIETLFVDEGFGSLDEDTLEEVMDVLDGLRSGGRSVGLVSHVADLRHRIPAQIEVIKGRDGSRLSVAAG